MNLESRSPRRDRGTDLGLSLALAVALTLLNVARPVAIDDPAYLRQATWWAAHPLDPLGGEAVRYQSVVPAARMAAAPVAIAWLALGTALWGANEWALKLWLFPFAWLLVASLDALLRRISPSLARPLLVATIFSPALLPSFGFMLDLPMLAFSLAALATFARSVEHGDRGTAVVAGLLMGLALQTKYTAAPALVALVVWGGFARARRHGWLATSVALLTFAAIEIGLYRSAGTSPAIEYFAGRGARDPFAHSAFQTAERLAILMGSAAPALLPLGLMVLGAPRRWVHVMIAAVALGFAALALAGESTIAWLDRASGGRVLNFDNLTIGWMGPVLIVIAFLVLIRILRTTFRTARSARTLTDVTVAALAVWFATEWALAPFVSASASVRRLLGAIVALTLVMTRLAQQTIERDPERRADVLACACLAVVLGTGFWMADRASARAEIDSVALARDRIAKLGGGGRIAYVGDHWGAFQHAAARARLRRVLLGDAALRSGDWLLVAESVGGRESRVDPDRAALVDSLSFPQTFPLTTRHSFYDGRQALRRTRPDEIGVRLWRVNADGEVLVPSGR